MFAVPALYMQAKEAAEIAHKDAIVQKKEQALKRASEEAEKAGRAQKRRAKDTREINAEMARTGKIDRRLFTILPI
jgi:hypothetical protein